MCWQRARSPACIIALGVAAVVLAAPESALHLGCDTWVLPLGGDGSAGSDTVYGEFRETDPADLEFFVYLEDNDRDGLQPAQPHPLLPPSPWANPCREPAPDLLLL